MQIQIRLSGAQLQQQT